MERQIQVLIADDHTVLRESLADYIDKQKDMKVVGHASNGLEAIKLAKKLNPNVLVVDITMPECGGIEVIEKVNQECPSVRTLVLTMHEGQTFLRSVLSAGGYGYITKRAASQDLLSAIRQVHQGRSYINVGVDNSDLKGLVDKTKDLRSAKKIPALSVRERQVLKLLALGHTNNEISNILTISRSSVETYRQRITMKLGIKSRAKLVAHAIELNLLDNNGESAQ